MTLINESGGLKNGRCYSILGICKFTQGMNYEMRGTILSKTVKEKDLGVTMNADRVTLCGIGGPTRIEI